MQTKEKVRKRVLFPIFLTYFLDNFGLAVIYPIFTPLFLQQGHLIIPQETSYFLRTLLLGILIGAFPLAQFFGAPLIGQFSDRSGRKKAFLFTIACTAFGYTMTAISIFYNSLPMLFASRFFTGLFAGNLTLCLASIADMSPDEKTRSKNFGQIGAVGGLSFIIAIAAGGIFSDSKFSTLFNPSLPFWITATLAYVNLLVLYFLFQETHPVKGRPSLNPFRGIHHIADAIRNRQVRRLYCINFLFMLAWVASMQFFPTYLIRHFYFTTTSITFCLIGVGFAWSLTNLWINRSLASHLFPGKTLMYSLLALGILLSAVVLFHSPSSFLLLFFPAVCCASLCWTNGLATISLKAPIEMQGSILGINQSMISVAAMISPPIGGLLSGLSRHAVYIFSGLICLIAFALIHKRKALFTSHHS